MFIIRGTTQFRVQDPQLNSLAHHQQPALLQSADFSTPPLSVRLRATKHL
ncbi:hypothetical protein ACQRD4_08145 [Streptococcus hyointestinalis]|nr:hypothetical protein [Streptococcus hyointestinalis]